MVLSPVLVTGGGGQLATALMRCGAGHNLRLVGRPVFDFERLDAIPSLLRDIAPSLIINAAAYTAVDKAETDADAAYRANSDGPRLIADYCTDAGIPLIHVSTDYVFDGDKGAPYVETDAPRPTGVYGASKLAGEAAILTSGARAIILRTSWVYATTGRNFLQTMLDAAKRTDRLRVVADQRGTPTAAGDLAATIMQLAGRLAIMPWNPAWRGIFHATGSGATTWHGFATAIFEEAAKYGVTPPTIEPIASTDWPTLVRRPPDSRLDGSKLGRTFGIVLPEWRDALSRTIADLSNPPAFA